MPNPREFLPPPPGGIGFPLRTALQQIHVARNILLLSRRSPLIRPAAIKKIDLCLENLDLCKIQLREILRSFPDLF